MFHHHPIRVYYEHTDAGGVVYHAKYLNFCEQARSEFLRVHGFSNSALKNDHQIVFVVHHLNAKFHKSARLDDFLEVQTFVMIVKKASLVMKQSIFCHNDLIFSMDVGLACVDHNGKACAMPDNLRQVFDKNTL
jgi:acyl-CoA thioester hydrolase